MDGSEVIGRVNTVCVSSQSAAGDVIGGQRKHLKAHKYARPCVCVCLQRVSIPSSAHICKQFNGLITIAVGFLNYAKFATK